MGSNSQKPKKTIGIMFGIAGIVVLAACLPCYGSIVVDSGLARGEVRLSIWLVLLLLLILSGLVAAIITRRMIRPLRELTHQAEQLIADSQRTQRLEVNSGGGIGILAAVINRMLDERERRQTEHQEQVHMLQALLDAIPHPIFYKDRECRYIGCNHAFEQAFGIGPGALTGKTYHTEMPADAAAMAAEVEHALIRSGGTRTFETVITIEDGSERAVIVYEAALANCEGVGCGLVGTYVDITDRKEYEHALVRQQEFTENLLLSAAVATFVIDPRHQTVIWNRACEILTGVAAGEVVGTSDHWRAFYPQKRACLADVVLDRTIERTIPSCGNYRQSPFSDEGLQAEGWYELAGKRRYILFTAAPVRDARGEMVAAIETIEDITDRKEREDELAAVAQAVSIGAGEGFFAAAAHYMAKTLGTDYVLIGSLDEQNLEQVHTLVVAAKGGFAPNFTFSLKNTPCAEVMDGRVCCYPERARESFPNDKLLRDLAIEGYIGVPLRGTGNVPLGVLIALHRERLPSPDRARSILKIFAARTAAELQRRLDEVWLRKLSHAVSQSPVSIIVTDPQGRIEFVNPKYSRVTGYSADEAIGTQFSILQQEGRAKSVQTEASTTIRQGNVWEGVVQSVRKDGELYWERANIGPIRNEHGTITNFIAINEDITVQKGLEGALRHAQKMEAVGQLAGGVAHDFNNILTAIIGYAGIAEIRAGSDDQLKGVVQQIVKAAERGANLTKSLLTFSRKQAANIQLVELNDVVRRSVKLLSRLIGENIELNVSLAVEPLMVLADSLEIEQVVMNLVTNARDAMPDGGIISLVSGRAEMDRQFVQEYGFGVPGTYAVLCVTDTGVGMDEKTAEKIFEPFYTTKENGQGTGLGLAIVYNIVKSHKGNVICTSKPGIGTSLTVYLPLQGKGEAPVIVPGEQSPVEAGSELILIAEDDPDIRTLLQLFLEKYGYRVVATGDGLEAVDRFNELQQEIDLVVLDAGLPKCSGMEVLERLRALRPNLKVIIVSGYAENAVIAEGVEHTRFLPKPIGPTDLVRAVREELDR